MYDFLIEPLVRAALLEDIAHGGDITTDAIVARQATATAHFVARKAGVVYGHAPARLAFTLLDPQADYQIVTNDGQRIEAGATLATITAQSRAVLTGERTALNFLGRLCGIATATRTLADLASGTKARIVCTRKTTPGLRILEKAAVIAGGGSNHRFGLDDAVLIKDNHIVLAGGIEPAVAAVRARTGHMVKVEVEVDSLEQLETVLRLPVDAVLLDNMTPQELTKAVAMVNGRILTEASGTISAATVAQIAASGVDLISSGWITHSAPALDIGLDMAV